ncbi:benzoate-CoA ligase family protein [Nisaea acidiphila]|uniref:Benzoate-CoA ligase family protein n=1 Tax=Nisaea acidiphila TaxID=1862145 RepID=A0A9J7AYQ3_9PROT|nr:benzoate-CoA ligase family protein [Nisaea acidiphila]UUX51396.1 benzoate-CoA ligase family protein [Nisaea acidiphila]
MAQDAGAARFYNAAEDLIGRNLKAGRGDKIAVIDGGGSYTYSDIAERVERFANAIRAAGVLPEQRVVLALHDSVDFPTAFLGAIRAGAIPVPVNTRLAARDYAYILADSRAEALFVSANLKDLVLGEAEVPRHVIVSGGEGEGSFAAFLETPGDDTAPAETTPDDMCFWLYTSGTTGMPKGAVHLHSHLMLTAELYAVQTLGISEADTVYSAAKLFFAYGLGNGLTFPFAVGATAILLEGPPDPASVSRIIRENKPTVFFGVPTLYGMLLASKDLPEQGDHALRLCVSAGEALPEELLNRWRKRVGTEILDGIGTTEMLHIFLSNRQGEVVPGATGKAVPGYELRLVDDEGNVCKPGEMGVLEVSGPTAAVMYWNQRAKSLDTFRGPWTRTGDKYVADENGVYTYCGRNDDMMKVGGIYVSPFEVEGALLKHEAVLEAAVVGHPDHDGLIKPKAFVVLSEGVEASDALTENLTAFVKNDLATYKYPRWIIYADTLPKTATGKIQRFKLRETA